MKIALGLFKSKTNEINENLVQIEVALEVASKQNVDLVLFGESFLQGKRMDKEYALILDSTGIFKLKLLALNYDVALGVGFYEQKGNELINSYLVLNKDGSVLLHQQANQPRQSFLLNDKEFLVVLGDDGFEETEKIEKIVLWPMNSNATPKEWFSHGMARYREQAYRLSDEVILVNTMSEDTNSPSYGGGFYLKNNKLVVNQPMEQIGLSIFEI